MGSARAGAGAPGSDLCQGGVSALLRRLEDDLSETCDVVVVGAGLGGLSAATCLAAAGRDVVLLERHNVPGGYATSFVRGRYEFEVALHQLSGMGSEQNPGPLLRYLERLGVTDHMDLVRLDTIYRSIFPGLDLTLPVGFDACTDVMCAAFPHDADGIRRFLRRIARLGKQIEHFNRMLYWSSGLEALGQALRVPAYCSDIVRYAMSTFGAVLQRDVKDPTARAVISQFWGYIGLPPSRAPHLFLGGIIATFIGNGPCHVKGGSQALSSAFATRFEALGGDLRLNCGVRSIRTDRGKVTGVITEHGDEIRAGHVVSNLDPVSTCRELIGAERVPNRFWRSQKGNRTGVSSFGVYLGLARPPAQLGLTDHAVFINESIDAEEHFARTRRIEPPGAVAITSYTPVLPEMTPAGTSMVALATAMYAEPWFDLPPERYVETKSRIAGVMLDRVEEVFPGVRAATEVVEVGTPVTNMRYGGQVGGAIYGTDQVPTNSILYRTPQKGPLGGLFFVGSFTQPGGGFEPAMMSGQLAGRQILAATPRALRRV